MTRPRSPRESTAAARPRPATATAPRRRGARLAREIVDPDGLEAVGRARTVRAGLERAEDADPDLRGAGRAREAGRPIVVEADPAHDQVVVRETREPTVAQVVRRARLARDREIRGQLLPGGATRAALHDLHERLVERIDGGRIGGLLHLYGIALQHLSVLAEHAPDGAQ